MFVRACCVVELSLQEGVNLSTPIAKPLKARSGPIMCTELAASWAKEYALALTCILDMTY